MDIEKNKAEWFILDSAIKENILDKHEKQPGMGGALQLKR